MPEIGAMFSSDYLKADDVATQPLVLTVKGCVQQTVGQGADAQDKPCLGFNERDEMLVLNKTNAAMLSHLFQSSNTDHWVGKQVELYQEMVTFAGRVVPAIRVRMPGSGGMAQMAPQQTMQQPMQQNMQPQQAMPDDGIPF